MMTKQRIPARLVAWAVVVVAVAVVAYLAGHRGTSSTVTVTGPGIGDLGSGSGTAYVGANEPLNKSPYGFAYSMPGDINWSDANGGLHQGGRPSCLPVAKAVRLKNIEAIQFTIPGGVTTGTVIWVQC
jgi:hypothetical protein